MVRTCVLIHADLQGHSALLTTSQQVRQTLVPCAQGRTSRKAGAAGAGRAASGRQRAQRGAAQRHVVRAGVAAHLQQAVARVRLRARDPVLRLLA